MKACFLMCPSLCHQQGLAGVSIRDIFNQEELNVENVSRGQRISKCKLCYPEGDLHVNRDLGKLHGFLFQLTQVQVWAQQLATSVAE